MHYPVLTVLLLNLLAMTGLSLAMPKHHRRDQVAQIYRIAAASGAVIAEEAEAQFFRDQPHETLRGWLLTAFDAIAAGLAKARWSPAQTLRSDLRLVAAAWIAAEPARQRGGGDTHQRMTAGGEENDGGKWYQNDVAGVLGDTRQYSAEYYGEGQHAVGDF